MVRLARRLFYYVSVQCATGSINGSLRSMAQWFNGSINILNSDHDTNEVT